MERNHDDGHVVKGLSVKTVFQYAFHPKPAELVDTDRLDVRVFVLLNLVRTRYLSSITAQPNAFVDVFVRQFVEDSITAQNDEIVMLCNLENLDLRLCFYYVRIAAPVFKLGFWVTKGSTDGESSR